MNQNLKNRITQALETITGQKGQPERQDLLKAMRELDGYKDDAEIPARLQHFLQGRSYQKAWQYLQGELPPSGSCSGKT